MAEDQSQRPFRSNEARTGASGSGSDPLAELARLIGQTDPFSEFGRNNSRASAPRSSAPQPPAPIEYAPRPADAEPQLPLPEVPPYAPASYGRQTYGSAPFATGNDLYQVESEPGAYPDAADAGYETDPYEHNGDHQQDSYDDVPPSRRRAGIVVIAGVFALAVIGTAGAFGYRAIFGSSGASGPPPVIKAETAPSKIVPAAVANKDPNKLITDRVNEGGAGERLVSRQETPVDVNRQAGSVFPPPQAPLESGAGQSPLGSGVVGTEPKRVRTISILPDQVGVGSANAMPSVQPPTTASAPPRVVNITPTRPAAPPAAEPEPAQRAPAARPVQQQQQAAAPSNAPLSLVPNAQAPSRAAPPARTASAPTQLAPGAPANAAAGGGFAVQLTSQRSEAEAQSAFRSLQSRFPDQLGNQQMVVRRVDLGEKGVYYRAMVGPFANGSDATGLCSSLKAAGGQCIVQKN